MPDIHWQIGEDTERETIASAPPKRRSPRPILALLLVVIVGASLGILQRAIPEPASKPQPAATLSPTHVAVPAKLFDLIDRQVQALADGGLDAYLQLCFQRSVDEDVRKALGNLETQRRYFTAWDRPKDGGPLYTIVDFDLLTAVTTNSIAWADVRQFRNGRYFRETRFYIHTNDHWECSSEDDFFRFALLNGWKENMPNFPLWSGRKESVHTPHFDVTYAIEDRDVISPTLQQLEEDYQVLCRALGCAIAGEEPTLTVKMAGDDTPVAIPGKKGIELPSPRTAGFFESGRAYSLESGGAHSVLAEAIVDRLYGRYKYDRPGSEIFLVGWIWAVGHL